MPHASVFVYIKDMMNQQKIKFIIIQTGTVLAILAFAILFHESFFGSSVNQATYASAFYTTENVKEIKKEVTQTFAKPSQLLIPSIDVDAKVQLVGLTAKGEMGIPTNFTDVGWYQHGTIPGEVGSAVIDGHVDNALGLKGVFKYLKDVKMGESVYIKDVKGNTHEFIIREVVSYKYDETPTEEIFHEDTKRLIRLITCGGKWIKTAKTYDTRVVVTAEYIRTQDLDNNV